MDGSVRGEERHLAIKNFGKQPIFVFLLSTRAGRPRRFWWKQADDLGENFGIPTMSAFPLILWKARWFPRSEQGRKEPRPLPWLVRGWMSKSMVTFYVTRAMISSRNFSWSLECLEILLTCFDSWPGKCPRRFLWEILFTFGGCRSSSQLWFGEWDNHLLVVFLQKYFSNTAKA